MNTHYDVAALGAGPGGYTAAIRAAQPGKSLAVVGVLGKRVPQRRLHPVQGTAAQRRTRPRAGAGRKRRRAGVRNAAAPTWQGPPLTTHAKP
jgi:thioredoxin reductase